MGGEISTNVSRKEKRENIRDRNMQIRDVENFIVSAFSCCNRIEAMWNILASETGYKAFRNFVESEMSSEYLLLFNECRMVKEAKKPTMYVMRKYVDDVLKDYILEGAEIPIIMSPALVAELKAVPTETIESYNDPVGYMFELLAKVESEVVALMARDQFNRFLVSRFYKNWRANERGRAVAATTESAKAVVDQYSARISARAAADAVKGRNNSRSFRSVVPEDMTARAFSSIKSRELHELLAPQSWLSALILGAEILPIGLSLAKVSKLRKGFPLVYVNKYFETMTGFSRNKVIGKNCKDFIQCRDTEKEKMAEMSEALKSRQAITTVVTNIKETGVKFRHMLSLKPIFDYDKQFVYVIGLHVQVASGTEYEDEMGKVLLVDQLSKLIPATIIEEINERKPASCWDAIRIKCNRIAPMPQSPRRRGSGKSEGKSGGGMGSGSSSRSNSPATARSRKPDSRDEESEAQQSCRSSFLSNVAVALSSRISTRNSAAARAAAMEADRENEADNSARLRRKSEAASAKLRARALSVEESERQLAAQAEAARAVRARLSTSIVANSNNSSSSSDGGGGGGSSVSRLPGHSSDPGASASIGAEMTATPGIVTPTSAQQYGNQANVTSGGLQSAATVSVVGETAASQASVGSLYDVKEAADPTTRNTAVVVAAKCDGEVDNSRSRTCSSSSAGSSISELRVPVNVMEDDQLTAVLITADIPGNTISPIQPARHL